MAIKDGIKKLVETMKKFEIKNIIMEKKYKFNVGEYVKIINVKGPLNLMNPVGIVLKDLIGKELKVIKREYYIEPHYNLDFDNSRLSRWFFHEYNLSKDISINYQDIVDKVFYSHD